MLKKFDFFFLINMIQLLLIILTLSYTNSVNYEWYTVFNGDYATFEREELFDGFLTGQRLKNGEIYARDLFIFEMRRTSFASIRERYKYVPGLQKYLSDETITLKTLFEKYGGWTFVSIEETISNLRLDSPSIPHFDYADSSICASIVKFIVTLTKHPATKLMYVDIRRNINIPLNDASLFDLSQELAVKPRVILNNIIANDDKLRSFVLSHRTRTIPEYTIFIVNGESPDYNKLFYNDLESIFPNTESIKSVNGKTLREVIIDELNNVEINNDALSNGEANNGEINNNALMQQEFSIDGVGDPMYKEAWQKIYPDSLTLTQKQFTTLIDNVIHDTVIDRLDKMINNYYEKELTVDESKTENLILMHQDCVSKIISIYRRGTQEVQNFIEATLDIHDGVRAFEEIEYSMRATLDDNYRRELVNKYTNLIKVFDTKYHSPSVRYLLYKKIHILSDDIKVIPNEFVYHVKYSIIEQNVIRKTTYVVAKGTHVNAWDEHTLTVTETVEKDYSLSEERLNNLILTRNNMEFC